MAGNIFEVCQTSHLGAMKTWRSKTISLRYSLSYVKLFEMKFKALEDPQTFDPNQVPASEIQTPFEEVPQNHDVVVARHQLLAAEIPVIQRLPTMLRYAPRQLLHFYTDLRGGPEQAFKAMSPKTRATVLRKVRSYQKFCGGELRWQTYRKPDEMLAYLEQARQVARKTYQERLFDSGIPDSQDFSAAMVELAKRNLVRGFLLFHGEKAIAYLYTPAPDGFLIYDYLGYDPDYADHSPGTVLQYLALEALYAEQQFPLYYWGFGYSQTKHIFSTGRVLGTDIFYFRPTLRNRLAVYLHYGADRLSGRVGTFLDRLGFKQRIKRWLKRN